MELFVILSFCQIAMRQIKICISIYSKPYSSEMWDIHYFSYKRMKYIINQHLYWCRKFWILKNWMRDRYTVPWNYIQRITLTFQISACFYCFSIIQRLFLSLFISCGVQSQSIDKRERESRFDNNGWNYAFINYITIVIFSSEKTTVQEFGFKIVSPSLNYPHLAPCGSSLFSALCGNKFSSNEAAICAENEHHESFKM